MASFAPASPEAPKKPTPMESVEGFIARKKSEKSAEGGREVQRSAEGVQREVAEVMAGIEKPREDMAEKGEKKGEQGGGGGGQTASAGITDESQGEDWRSVVFPDEEVMIKKIRTAVELQIQVEMKKAKKLQGRLTSGGAQEYSTVIARIRKLKTMLANLFMATVDYLKTLYMKYFRPDGRRRNTGEINVD